VTRLQAWMPMAGAAGASRLKHLAPPALRSQRLEIGFNTVPFATFKTEILSSSSAGRALVCVQSRPEPSPGTTMKRFRLASLTLVTFAAAATICMASNSARAHPHVWITAKVEVVFSASVATAIRHRWTFDPGYSAYVTQGLAKNADGKLVPDELLQLAKENVESLADFEYFTALKANGAKQAFDPPRDYGTVFEHGQVTLHFLLPLKAPASGKLLTLEIYDPTFFVAFSLAEDKDAVTLENAPKGCAATLTRPKPLEVTKQQPLSESFFNALTSASNFGGQFANRALVACP
jgi:ABC-type uncharacterized transport system substrate-binding protein